VEIVPPNDDTLRIRLLSLSAIRKPPSEVAATSAGKLSCAVVAGWPSR
jgi:hypothetical protein